MFKTLGSRKLAASATAIASFCIVVGFQNCSGFGKSSTGAVSLNLTSANILSVKPAATTVAPGATLQLSASGGESASYRFRVLGKGQIDQATGLYTAPAANNDDIVQVTDASGSAAFGFVKVAATGSPVALNPPALLIGFQSTYQFIATGGTPPFSYSVDNSTLGSIDPIAGTFTSNATAGQATVTAVDSAGLIASSNVTIQASAPTLATIYAPNPLAFGQTAIFYTSNVTNTLLTLQSGPGVTSGLTYSPGYATGPANLLLNYQSFQLPVKIPLTFINGNLACPHGKQIFNYTGADQIFNPPANCPSVTIKMWGGGGSVVGVADPNQVYTGGGGGFVSAILAATETQNLQPLTIIVAGGGSSNSTGAYGGGGGPGFASAGIATGAGRSAIRVNGTEILTAGGGGGGYYGGPSGSGCGQVYLGAGGAGGGLVGGNGSGDGANGTGGTQTSGGRSANDGGSQFQGGSIFSAAGGGGGSSYIGGGAGQTIYEAVTIQGSGYLPGNMSDPDYVSPIGLGGGGTSATVGGNGMVVISW